MKAPPISSMWERHDGAWIEVSKVEGRDVICKVRRHGARPGTGQAGRRKIRLVRSDFNSELGNTFVRRIG